MLKFDFRRLEIFIFELCWYAFLRKNVTTSDKVKLGVRVKEALNNAATI